MKGKLLLFTFVGIFTLNHLSFAEIEENSEISSKEDVSNRIEMLENMEIDIEKLANFDEKKLNNLKEKYNLLKEKYKDIDVKEYKEKLEFLNFEKNTYKDILQELEKTQAKIKEKLNKEKEKEEKNN